MTAINQATTAEVWSRYWRTGTVHSCGIDFKGNYTGALAGFWERQFAQVPEDGLIVDLGTGNGAIPLLAKAFAESNARTFRLHGVDAADVAPASAADAGSRYDGIRFHPGTSMLSLPFADRSIDLVCSQFAIEYVAWNEACAEIARAIAPDGRLAYVMHTTDSRIHATTLDQLVSFDVLFESGLCGHAVAMAHILSRANTPASRAALQQSPEAERIRAALNTAAGQVAERIAQATVPLMLARTVEAISEVLRSAAVLGEEQATAVLGKLQHDLRDEHYRLQHLREVALSPESIGAAAESLRQHGFIEVAFHPLDQSDGMRIGWAITAHR